MTYAQLLAALVQMNSEQLNSNVTVYLSDNDEYYPGDFLMLAGQSNDVLDENHPYIRVGNSE